MFLFDWCKIRLRNVSCTKNIPLRSLEIFTYMYIGCKKSYRIQVEVDAKVITFPCLYKMYTKFANIARLIFSFASFIQSILPYHKVLLDFFSVNYKIHWNTFSNTVILKLLNLSNSSIVEIKRKPIDSSSWSRPSSVMLYWPRRTRLTFKL